LAEVNEDFYTLTGILPNNISEDDYSQITCNIPPSNKNVYDSQNSDEYDGDGDGKSDGPLWTKINPDRKTVVAINSDSLNEGNDWALDASIAIAQVPVGDMNSRNF
jgi:hypothetical protein